MWLVLLVAPAALLAVYLAATNADVNACAGSPILPRPIPSRLPGGRAGGICR